MSAPETTTDEATAPAGPSPSRRGSFNLMHPIRWVPAGTKALLDVGCNVGSLLTFVREEFPGRPPGGGRGEPRGPGGRAAGTARGRPPSGWRRDPLPFPDQSFDCVTCIEVLEHVPAENRAASLAEIHRVLRPGGRLVLRTPHDGLFTFLDPNNLRFRFPRLYGRLIGRGSRDAGYDEWSSGVVWHHHFTKAELLALAGEGWEIEASRSGGLLIFPLVDLASWPFYRRGRPDHPIRRALGRLMDWDIGVDYGRASFDILLILRRR